MKTLATHVCVTGTSSGGIGCIFDADSEVFIKDAPTPVGLAFDSSHNLWVSALGDMTLPAGLLEYSKSQLSQFGSNPNPFPATVISSSAFGPTSTPGGLVFNNDGTLFVADGGGAVFGFSSSVLNAGSSTDATPSVTLKSSAFSHPKFVQFDKNGNLFVSDVGNNTVLGFDASQVAAGGSQSPSVTLSGNGLNSPGQLSFDTKWRLYVPNSGDTSILIYGAGAVTGAKPIVTINSSLINHPVGAGLGGSLYLITRPDGTIAGLSTSALLGGTAKINVTVGPVVSDPTQIATFNFRF